MLANPNSEILRVVASSCETPVFIYFESILVKNLERIYNAIDESRIENRINVAVPYFTNSNPHIISIISKHGAKIVIQSPEENEQLEESGLNSIQRIVSPTHLSKKDLNYFMDRNLCINLATLSNVKEAINANIKKIYVRIDLSPNSNQRHGIKPAQFSKLKKLLTESKRKLYGIHIYPGTQSSLESHIKYQKKAIKLIKQFPKIKEINLGGGFHFNYSAKTKKHFEWDKYFDSLEKNVRQAGIKKDVEFTIEPGRDILADTGCLLLRINGIERPANNKEFEIFTDGSYVHLPSATVKNRQHRIAFFDASLNPKENQKLNKGSLNGNTTLSSDKIFPSSVNFPKTLKEYDYVLVYDVGAYGAAQHMEFLNKAPCPEVIVNNNSEVYLITQKGRATDKIRNLLKNPQKLSLVSQ